MHFLFPHCFLNRLLQGHQKSGLCGKDSTTKSQNFRTVQFVEENFNVTRNIKFAFNMVENIVENIENAGYQHCLFLPYCFHKNPSFKLRIVW